MTIRISTALALILAAGSVAAQDGPTLSTADSEDYGIHLVGPDGRPVYAMVTTERAGDDMLPLRSCRQKCLEDWPLVTVEDDVTVAEGISADLAATLRWEDQNVAVFDSHTLFNYFRDTPGGEPIGQGISSYGGWWYLIRPDGALIETGVMPEIDG